MIGVIYPTHNTLAGAGLGPIPPVDYGFLLRSGTSGYITLVDGGRISIGDLNFSKKVNVLLQEVSKLIGES